MTFGSDGRRSGLRAHEGAVLGGLLLLAAVFLLPDLGAAASGSAVRLEHARIVALGVG